MDIPERLGAALADRYRLERPIGQGGMATVYLAHDIRHDRAVAVKVLRPDLAAVIGGDRFLSEIRTTANLQHPHILPLFDSGAADGFLYYVMPLVEGESLRQRLDRERQLPVDEAIRIARDVAGALDYAHRHDVIHRDIKPANILLNDGRPVVADFGIALALSAAGGGRLTETGLSLGTPHYMSPEQATAERDLTARSDVYSLACVLYEMLAGDPPHTGPNAQAVLMRILTEDPRPVTDIRRAVPLNVTAAITKALEKLPADRFESAAAFERALSDTSFSYERTSVAPSAGRVKSAAAPRNGGAWIRDPRSVAALAAVTLVLAAWAFVPRSPATETFPLRLSLDVGSVEPSEETEILFAISPDGRTIAMSAGVVGGERALWIKGADDGEFRRVAQTDGANDPAFSPDGEWIVYAGGDEALLKVRVTGGAPLTIFRDSDIDPFQPDWGRDGSIVFVGDSGVYRVRESAVPEILLKSTDILLWPRLLPDGSGVLLTDEGSRSVRLLDLATDSVTTLIAEGVDARYVESGHILFAHPDGGLFAVAFDLRRHAIVGQPIRVLDEVSVQYSVLARYTVSRNGTLVYGAGLVSNPDGPRQRELVIVRLSGGVDTLPLAPRDFGAVRWSPDGRSIAYESRDEEADNIFVYDVELGTTPRQITFAGRNTNPVWSPDGKRIAFGSMREGTNGIDVFVKSLDDTPEVRLIVRPGDQRPMQWPGADLLVFRSTEEGPRAMLMMRPDSGAEPRAYLRTEAGLIDIKVAPGGGLATYSSAEA